MKFHNYFFRTRFLLSTIILSALGIITSVTVYSQSISCSTLPPAQGDWIIPSTDACWIYNPIAISGNVLVYGKLYVNDSSALYFTNPTGNITVYTGGIFENYGNVSYYQCTNECDYGAEKCENTTIYYCDSIGDSDPCSEWIPRASVECCTDADCPEQYQCDTQTHTCYAIKETSCDNSIDDDGDGLVDCEDPDCAGQTGPNGVTCCQSDSDCPAMSCTNYGDVSGFDDPTATKTVYSCVNYECQATQTTVDCDSYDGWYGGGNLPGCGDDPTAEERDYYVNSTCGCSYNVIQTLDCDSQDQCGSTCEGSTAIGGIDYYVDNTTWTCTNVTESSQDCNAADCTTNCNAQCDTQTGDIYNFCDDYDCVNGSCSVVGTKKCSLVQDCVDTCTDSDASESDPFLVNGTVTDKDLCSSGQTSCPTSTYTDTCVNSTHLTEYVCNGNDATSILKNCNDYDSVSYDTTQDTCSWTDFGCSSGACKVLISDSYNCDAYDSVSGDTIYDYEVSSTSCTLGCTGTNCCDLITKICNSTTEGSTYDLEGTTYYCVYDGSQYKWVTQSNIPPEVCDDNHDNDLDNLIDCEDPDCAGQTGPNGVTCCQSDSDCPQNTTYCNTNTGDIETKSYSCVNYECQESINVTQDCSNSCSDSDSGQTYTTQGYVNVEYLCSPDQTSCPTSTYTDTCVNDTYVREYYCSGSNYASIDYNCKNLDTVSYDTTQDTCSWEDYVCSNGACAVNNSSNYDCDDYDIKTSGSTYVVDYEVSSTSCTLGCVGKDCCYIETSGVCNETQHTNCQSIVIEDITLYCTYDGSSWAWRTTKPAEVCDDGVDNDCDGYVDTADSDCVEICDNGIDDDGDGLVDCEDPNCAGRTGPNGVTCCQQDTDCNGGVTNVCSEDTLVTYYCDTNTYTCKSTSTTCSTGCTDTDSGIDYLTQGTVTDYTGCNNGQCTSQTYTDTCSGDTLTEYYCNGDIYSSNTKNCNDYDSVSYDTTQDTCSWEDYGCSNGACAVINSNNLDCDAYDSVSGDTIYDYEVSSTSCTLGCSNAGCCDVITKICDNTTEKSTYDLEGTTYYCVYDGSQYKWVTQSNIPPEVCDDNHDNDLDNLIDCEDPDCAGQTGPNGVTCCQSDSDCPSDYYYCSGDSVYFKDYYCDTNTNICTSVDNLTTNCNDQDGYYCNGDISEYRDYYCSGGACTYDVVNQTTCSTGCTDTDSGNDPFNKGTVNDALGCSNGVCENATYTDYCRDSVTLTEYYCSNGQKASTTIDCNSYDGWYQLNTDSTTRTFEYRDYSCNSGACIYNTIDKCYDECNPDTSPERYICSDDTSSVIRQTCGNYDSDPCYEWGNDTLVQNCNDQDGYYCNGDISEYRDYYCSGGACTYDVVNQTTCSTGCTDTDSGIDYLTQGTVTDYTGCNNGQCTSQTYTDYCSDSSTLVEFYCSNDNVSASINKNCDEYDTSSCSDNVCSWSNYVCSNGKCVLYNSGSQDCDNCDSVSGDTLIDCSCSTSTCTVGCSGCDCCDCTTITCESSNVCTSYTLGSTTYYCTYDGSSWAWRTTKPAEVCDDGVDNDCDGYVDCADPDCAGQTGPNGVTCCQSDSDCPSDYYYCSGNVSYFKDYYCDTTTYTCKDSDNLVLDCDSKDGWYDAQGNRVPSGQICPTDSCYKRDYYCSNGECTYRVVSSCSNCEQGTAYDTCTDDGTTVTKTTYYCDGQNHDLDPCTDYTVTATETCSDGYYCNGDTKEYRDYSCKQQYTCPPEYSGGVCYTCDYTVTESYDCTQNNYCSNGDLVTYTCSDGQCVQSGSQCDDSCCSSYCQDGGWIGGSCINGECQCSGGGGFQGIN